MSTRKERKAASLAKKEHDLLIADQFVKKVISPLFANILEEGRTPAFQMTLRQVKLDYGRDAERCFRLMFKLLQRGGVTRDGTPFKSQWVVNFDALKPYQEWAVLDQPLSSLLTMLKENNVIEEVWHKLTRQWMSKKMRDDVLKAQRARQASIRLYRKETTPEERAKDEALK